MLRVATSSHLVHCFLCKAVSIQHLLHCFLCKAVSIHCLLHCFHSRHINVMKRSGFETLPCLGPTGLLPLHFVTIILNSHHRCWLHIYIPSIILANASPTSIHITNVNASFRMPFQTMCLLVITQIIRHLFISLSKIPAGYFLYCYPLL